MEGIAFRMGRFIIAKIRINVYLNSNKTKILTLNKWIRGLDLQLFSPLPFANLFIPFENSLNLETAFKITIFEKKALPI
jgi:hypothetical protein